MLAVVNFVLVDDLSEKDPVAQKVEQGTAAEWLPAAGLALLGHMNLRAISVRGEIALECVDRSELEITLEYVAHDLRLAFVHLELAAVLRWQIVAKRRPATHPHAALLGGGDLVADSLARGWKADLRRHRIVRTKCGLKSAILGMPRPSLSLHAIVELLRPLRGFCGFFTARKCSIERLRALAPPSVSVV